MIPEGGDNAGPGHPEAPPLDRALWTAPPTPVRERVTGIAVSALAHIAAAGALYAALTLEPQPEPPGFREIPVEIVVEPAVPELAEPDEPAPPSDEPPETPRAAAENAREEPADAVVTALAEEALPSKEEPSTVAAREPPAEMPTASEPLSAELREATPEIIQPKPMDPSPSPSLGRLKSRPRAIVARPKLQPQPERKVEQKAAVRADATRSKESAREERPAARPRALAREREEARENGGHQAPAAARRVARAETGLQSPGPGRAAAVSVSPAASSYRSQVIAHLTRFKRYPLGAETRGAEGTPVVSFSLDGGGRVLGVALARSSGHADIDAETVAMVRRAVPFPAPPPGAPQTIAAAISFQLR